MKQSHVSKITTLCIAIALAAHIHGQENIVIGPYHTVNTPYKQGVTWSGGQKDTLLFSKILGYEKNISIFTTEQFGKFPENPPLIILFDRQFNYLTNYMLQSIEYMVVYGQIPRPVVVSIEAGREPDQRASEARWSVDGRGGFGEKIDEFVFDELIPFLETGYSVDRNQVIAYGHSWFGYHSTMLLVKRIPQLFGIISASPNSLVAEKRVDEVINSVKRDAPALTRKFFYRVASGHSIGDNIEVYNELTQKLGQLELPSNFDYKPSRFTGAVHPEVPILLFQKALYEMYEQWAELGFSYADPRKNQTFDDASLYDSLQTLSDKFYGFRIPISYVHMGWRIEYYRYLSDQKIADKGRIATWKFMISKFGERSEWCYGIAGCFQRLGDNKSATEYLNKTKKLTGKNKNWAGKIKELEESINKNRN